MNKTVVVPLYMCIYMCMYGSKMLTHWLIELKKWLGNVYSYSIHTFNVVIYNNFKVLYILWLCRGKILINVYVHVIIKCVLNHVRFYNNFHSDQKKTKNEKKYYANAKVSFPWHTLNTPSHTKWSRYMCQDKTYY